MADNVFSLGDAVGDVIKTQNQTTASQIRNNLQEAVTVNPDQEAGYQNLAKFTATPIDTVRANPQAIEQKASVSGIDAEDMTLKSPTTARFFTDTNNSKLAIDDISNMRDLESHVANVGLAEGLVNSFSLSAVRTYYGGKAWLGDKLDDQEMVDHALNQIKWANIAEETAVPQMDNTLGRWTYGAAKGIVNSVPALGVALINPLAGAGAFGLQAKTESYGRYRERGGTEDEAGFGSNVEAGISAATSFLPLKYIANKWGKTGAGRFLASLLAIDVGSEVAQTVAQSAVDTAIANPDKSWKDWASELPENVAVAATSALMFSGIVGAANATKQQFDGVKGRIDASQASTEYIQRLNDMATNSKLRTRDPERFAKFIQEANENSPVQDLYINVNDLAQSGVDVLKIGETIPALKEQITQAMQTNTDLKISVPDFATSLAGTELGQSMIDHLKVDPNAFSKAQSETYMKDEGQALEAEVEKVLAAKQGDEAFKASRQVVQDELTKQLKDTGRFTDDVNTPYATMLSNFYAVQAARLGKTPEEMFKQYPVSIQSDSVFGKASTLGANEVNQDAPRRITEADIDVETGKPVTFDFVHNTNSATKLFGKPTKDSPYGRGFEPSARYLTIVSDKAKANLGEGMIVDTVTFKNPLVIDNDNLNWKETLSKQYGGKTGKKLSEAIIADGYDGIITRDKNHLSEVVDFTTFDANKALYQGAITDTPEFKKFFEGSTVVNEDGTPKVVYHGTNEDFNTFNIGKVGTNGTSEGYGFYFTDDRNTALGYQKEGQGRVVEAYINMKKPIDVKQGNLKAKDMGNIIKKVVDAEVNSDPENVGDYRDTFLSNFVDTYSMTYEQAVAETARMLVEGNDTAVDQIAELSNVSGSKEATLAAVRDVTGYDGIKSEGFSGEGQGGGNIYIAWFPEQIKSVDNQGTFDPENPNIYMQGNDKRRGSFNTETNAITLFKSADLSTFLHESGHFFLETMNKIALDENAPAEIKADMDATLKWLGVKDMADWNSRDLEAKREAHEQFARGFEAYLFEGKSPNKEMEGIFARFRSWLLNIYRNIHALNVDVSDDMKAVFDRMLATADEIRDMEAQRAYAPFFAAAEEAGMTKEEFTAYQNLGIEATQEAQRALETRSIRDMKYASNAKSKVLKDLQKRVAAKRNSIRREVTSEVMAEPVNQVQTFLKRGIDPVTGEKVEGAFKLYIAEIEAMYGDTPAYKMITDKLGYGKYGMLGTENGIHPDQVADMFGFSSADEMIRAIVAAENPKEKIQALTDQRMLERYGDITSDEALSRAADEAIHNDVRMKFVATEMNALQKAIGGRKILAEAAKRYAENMVGRLKVRDLKASVYTSAEARSARAADLLRKEGDLQGAAIQKRNQLINMYAAKATYDAQEFIEKSVNYLKKFDKDTIRKTVDADYVDQINTMLERFSLKTQSLKSIDKQKSLVDWVEGQKELGIEPDIAPELLNEAYRKNYKDMTVEEMRGLVDAIKQVEHLGKLKNKLLTAKDNRDFATTVNNLITSIQENAGDKVADNRTRANLQGRAERLFKGFLAQHRKIASLSRELDGFKDGGPMWETFIRTMNEAGDKEAVMRAKATQDIGKLLDPIMKRGAGKMGGKGLFFESVGRSLNREERIGIALNTGNEGNMQRLLGGEGWTREQIQPILDTLTKEDWDFVQNVWDYFESYRPEIGAKERRVYGKEPDWVEPSPITTRYGEYKGGYYPIKYDPRQSVQAEQHADAELAKQQMKGAYTSATTRRSFTKSRVDEVTGRPLLYSMDGLYQGLNEVIHDLSWHEWLIDANRLLRNKGLDGAIRNRYGADFVKQYKTATQDIAAGEMPTGDALEKALAHVRAGATVAGLGFNLMNSVINTLGVTQSIVRIGPRWVALGVGEWARSPVALTKQIYEKSAFMKLRGQTQQRELNEIRNRVSGKGEVRQAIDRFMFLPMEVTQLAVDAPSWWGAYQKALAEGNVEDRAIALADQAVLDSQSGGQVKDLAAIQRGNGFKKLFTTFYGFFNTAYNLGVERTKATNFKDPRQVASLAGDYMLLYVAPAVMGALIKSALTNGTEDFEDPEKLAKMLANEQMSYMFGMMVGLREMTGAAQTLAGVNTYNTGYGGPAGLRFFNEIYKLGQQINQGEPDAALRRTAVNVAGVTLHLPSTQINRTLDGLTAIWDGKTQNPAALISGGPKD